MFVSNFVDLPSRALTNRLSTFSSESTLIDFAIRDAIAYSGIVGLSNNVRRIKAKSFSLVIIGKMNDVGKYDEKNLLNRLWIYLGG
jgi:hypothetical protein